MHVGLLIVVIYLNKSRSKGFRFTSLYFSLIWKRIELIYFYSPQKEKFMIADGKG